VCARGDGIRGSKDLRAEIGKFPNSTNERKQMSTKTMKQRIAVVAVTALTAGFLSVVSSPVANASNNDAHISLIASTTGAAVANVTEANARQVGWVSATNTAATLTANLITINGGDAQTGVCLSTCSLPFEVENTDTGVGLSVVVVGGVLSGIADSVTLTNGSFTSTAVAGDRKAVVAVAGTASSLLGVVTASSGVSTMQVQFYEGAGITGLTTSTAGTLVGSLTVTIAAANTAGTFSASNSTIATQISYAAGTTASGLLTYDNTSRIANGSRGAIYVALKDPYKSAITTGTVTATATGGSYVVIKDALPAAGDDFSATSAFATDTDLAGGDAYITVTQPVVNTAGTSTVTITLDGAVIATKTLNWSGDIASIALDAANSNGSFKNGADADFAGGSQAVVYVVKDAAGNAVTLTTAPTITSQTGSLVGASLLTTTTTNSTLQTSSLGYGAATMNVPTSSLNGEGTYKLRVVNALGANIDSAVITSSVSSGLNSFVVSWDKAVYAPGDLATMSISGKDIKGTTIADGIPLTGYVGAVASGLTSVGTACDATRTFSGGVVKCVYAAGNTDGSYSYSFDVTTATAQSPSVGAVKVAGASGTSNADVLKSIVALIASINKQIQALQKLILKR